MQAADSRSSPDIRVERDVDYGCGKALDVYIAHRTGTAPGPQPVVLLWHGVGPDERDVLEPLACAAAALGVTVFVPDWRSDAPDGGRGHLLSSVSFTREHASRFGGNADAIVLAGWSRGGKAAAGLAVNPMAAGGWRPAAVVCLAAGFSKPALITGTSPTLDLAAASIAPVPFWLVHGTHDPVVSVTESRKFASLLSGHGWPVQYEELPTDHAGVVMAEYDEKIRRCRPAEARTAVEAGRRTAETLHAATLAVGLQDFGHMPDDARDPRHLGDWNESHAHASVQVSGRYLPTEMLTRLAGTGETERDADDGQRAASARRDDGARIDHPRVVQR